MYSTCPFQSAWPSMGSHCMDAWHRRSSPLRLTEALASRYCASSLPGRYSRQVLSGTMGSTPPPSSPTTPTRRWIVRASAYVQQCSYLYPYQGQQLLIQHNRKSFHHNVVTQLLPGWLCWPNSSAAPQQPLNRTTPIPPTWQQISSSMHGSTLCTTRKATPTTTATPARATATVHMHQQQQA